MKITAVKLCIGLALAISTTAQSNWGNSAGMMPFGGQGFSQPMQSFGSSTPWGGQSNNQSRYQPRYNSRFYQTLHIYNNIKITYRA